MVLNEWKILHKAENIEDRTANRGKGTLFQQILEKPFIYDTYFLISGITNSFPTEAATYN